MGHVSWPCTTGLVGSSPPSEVQSDAADSANAPKVVSNLNTPAHRQEAARLLSGVDMPRKQGHSATCFTALLELCAIIIGFVDAKAGCRDFPNVGGTVQMFATVVPCISSVGAMRQFSVLFPGVTLEFAEQVSAIGEQ